MLTHLEAVDSVQEDEVGKGNRELSQSQAITKDCPCWPGIKTPMRGYTCLYLRRTGSILDAYLGSTIVRKCPQNQHLLHFHSGLQP
jgi:hypothetical protein